jgi:hypothetical protein
MLWRPWWGECKARVSRSWFAVGDFDLGRWVIGFGFDVAPTDFSIIFGPFSAGIERDEPPPKNYDDLPNWSRTLRRIVIKRLKMELRLELDLNIWLCGYMMADTHDHGVYLGPFSLQIEYDKCFNEPDSLFHGHR